MSSLSLYIHIPWCVKKCPYCDFNSHQPKQPITLELQSDYIKHLIHDLTLSLEPIPQQNRTELHSIFIGGGTPSLFDGSSIAELLAQVDKLISVPKNTEITLEANPGTFEQNKFSDFKRAGINRLSIGVQSFDNNSLKLLGRIHDSAQARAAINSAQELGFNFNIDLMHSLPEQTSDLALGDLEIALSHQPNHLSWYQLTIEPNTQFARHTPILPAQEIQENIYEQGWALLSNNGYQQYEISAFALDKKYQSRHNLNYWRYGDYIGIGAGAHSKLTSNTSVTRSWKQKSPGRYLDFSIEKVSGSSLLNSQEILLEYMMNKLRVLEPITEQELFESTSLKFVDIQNQISQGQTQGWLIFQNNHLVITELGRSFLNNLILLFA